MPDDDLFPTPEGEPPVADPPAPSGDAPLTQDDVTSIMQEFVQNNTAQMGKISAQQAETATTLSAVQDVLSRLGLSGTPEGGDPPEVDSTEFFTNPTPTIQRIAQETADAQLREQVAPLLSQIVEQTHTNAMLGHKADIDREFGAGQWDKEFAPEIDPILTRTRKDAPSQLGNVEALSKLVNSVKGMKFATLQEARTATAQKQAEAKETEQANLMQLVTSNMTGGITHTTPKATLSEEAKEHIEKEFNATGYRPDEKHFMAALNSGSTLEEFLESQKKLNGSASK